MVMSFYRADYFLTIITFEFLSKASLGCPDPFFFDLSSKDEYKVCMTGFIPVFFPRRLRGNRNLATDSKKSLSGRTTASEFEFAYQARIAVERIRFAIRQTDQLAANQPVLQEVGMQLLDALDRLETAERHFQENFRIGFCRSQGVGFDNERNSGNPRVMA
jgi:hypothetical protein